MGYTRYRQRACKPDVELFRKRADASGVTSGITWIVECEIACLDGMRQLQACLPADLKGRAIGATEEAHSTSSSSMVGSKAANGGQVKTGQRMWPGTQMFYPVVCILGKPNRSTELMTVGFVL